MPDYASTHSRLILVICSVILGYVTTLVTIFKECIQGNFHTTGITSFQIVPIQVGINFGGMMVLPFHVESVSLKWNDEET